MSIGIAIMGLVVGFLVGLTGVGGAALLTSALILLGINPAIAVGTDLFYNSITKFFGTCQHFRQKTINLRLVKLLALGSIPGSVISISILYVFNSLYQNQEQIIEYTLGYVLIAVAISILIRIFWDKKIKENRWLAKPLEEKRHLTIGIGFVLGFIVCLTSVGSGSLFALAMLYLYRLTASELVGTDIAHAFFLVTVAGVLHVGLGNVDFQLAANLLIGSIPGVIIGSALTVKVPAKPLRVFIAILVLISGLKLL